MKNMKLYLPVNNFIWNYLNTDAKIISNSPFTYSIKNKFVPALIFFKSNFYNDINRNYFFRKKS